MHRTISLAFLAVTALGASAGADDSAASDTPAIPDTKPHELMTLPKGGLVIDGFLEVNLSKDGAGKPVSLTPDAWYGVDDKITVGLVHSSVAQTGFVGGVGDSLCLTGTSSGCAHVYKDVGALVRYRLQSPWALDGGLVIASINQPFLLDMKLGAAARWRFDKIVVELQPNLFIALTQRSSGSATIPGRSERLNLPGTVGYPVAPKVEVEGQLGLSIPFSHAGDFFSIPFAVGARYRHDDHLSAGLMLALPAVIKGSGLSGGVDIRTLTLGVTYVK